MFRVIMSSLLIFICLAAMAGEARTSFGSTDELNHHTQDISSVSSDSSALSIAATHTHAPGGNCENPNHKHSCHLGHCGFVIFSQPGVPAPIATLESRLPASISLTGIVLSGPRRPPRA